MRIPSGASEVKKVAKTYMALHLESSALPSILKLRGVRIRTMGIDTGVFISVALADLKFTS